MNDPRLSIITVVFNGEGTFKRTIDSVACQSYGNIEYIVIDGGSTDGTLDIIKESGDVIDYWISERDKGIYDAMNKGIGAAAGDFLFFLNADDYLPRPGVIAEVMDRLRQGGDGYCGSVNMVDRSGKVLYPLATVAGDPFSYLMHQGFIYKKRLHEIAGAYNTQYVVNADYDFYLRLLDKRVDLIYGEILVCHMQAGGISGTMGYLSAAETLYIQIRNKLPVKRALRIFQFKLVRISGKRILVKMRLGSLVNLLKQKKA